MDHETLLDFIENDSEIRICSSKSVYVFLKMYRLYLKYPLSTLYILRREHLILNSGL